MEAAMQTLRCEWVECGSEDCATVEEFCSHMIQHKPFIENREDDNGAVATWYCCMWECCGFDSSDYEKVVFHINYHAYHTKIKYDGSKLIMAKNLPQCHLNFAGRNLFAMQPHSRICEWNECNTPFDNYQYFLWHVETHMKHVKGFSNHPVICEWRNCYKKFYGTAKLRSHGKVHTGERVIGCPTCGTQFANKTKLIDHCTRQSATRKYKCSHCLKSYPSERILRDHIRLHIDCYKCPMCEVTFPFPYTLNLHIRYRHIDSRPFKCNFCDHRSKTERDLENHQLSHCNENFWVCEQAGCEYSSRQKSALMRHMVKCHKGGLLSPYVCHICDFKCARGTMLTAHLRKSHSYRWGPGQSKFRYIKGEDGFFRLQTFRYAVADISQLECESANQNVATEKKIYRCNQVSSDKFEIVLETAEEENDIDFEPYCVIPIAHDSTFDPGVAKNTGNSAMSNRTLEEALRKHFKLPESTTLEFIE